MSPENKVKDRLVTSSEEIPLPKRAPDAKHNSHTTRPYLASYRNNKRNYRKKDRKKITPLILLKLRRSRNSPPARHPSAPAAAAVRPPQALEHVLLNGDDPPADGLAAVKGGQLGLGVAVEEERDRVAVSPARVDDAVHGAAVDALCPEGEHVADVDDVGVAVGRHGVPGLRVRVLDLQAAC